MNMNPIGNRLIIRPVKIPPRIGSIFIPESARANTLNAVVIAIGDGVQSSQLLPGVTVVYDKFAGLKVSEERNWIMLTEEDIIGVLYEEEEDAS